MLTINVAVLLVIIVVLRLRRRTQARSRFDEKMTVLIVLALGIMLAPTDVGQGIAGLPRPARQRRLPGGPVIATGALHASPGRHTADSVPGSGR